MNSTHTTEHKSRVWRMVELLAWQEPTQAELAKYSGLARSSVGRWLKPAIEAGIVQACGLGYAEPGKKKPFKFKLTGRKRGMDI